MPLSENSNDMHFKDLQLCKEHVQILNYSQFVPPCVLESPVAKLLLRIHISSQVLFLFVMADPQVKVNEMMEISYQYRGSYALKHQMIFFSPSFNEGFRLIEHKIQ